MRMPLVLALAIVTSTEAAQQPPQPKPGEGYGYSDTTDALNNQAAAALTPQEKTLAKKWMLNESDWVKFKEVMKGPRGTWTPNIDPITALGVSAKTKDERMRYAEIWMRVEAKRKEGELAFERARMVAAKKVFGNMKTIENDQWIEEWKKENVSINKTLAYFVDYSCLEDCKDDYQKLADSIPIRTRLDIYFAPGATGDDITKWAQHMGISPEVVRARKVTLNFDKGKAARMGINMDALPQVREVAVK